MDTDKIIDILEGYAEPFPKFGRFIDSSKFKEIARVISNRASEANDIHNVTTRNWFEKLPLHWKLAYYLIGGIVIGYLLHYVW